MKGMPAPITPIPHPHPKHHELFSLVLDGGTRVLSWLDSKGEGGNP